MMLGFVLGLVMLTPLGLASTGNATVVTPDNFSGINDSDPIYWYNKGDSLLNLYEYNESIKAYIKAIELNRSYVEAWNHMGIALLYLRKYDEAIKCYNESIGINPKDGIAWNGKGVALGQSGRNNEAIQAYDKAIELDPKFADAWRNRAGALNEVGRYDEAVQNSEIAINLNPRDGIAWNNKGAALVNQGKHDEALECFSESIRLYPLYEVAWYNKGEVLRILGKYDKAIECFEEALRINKQYADAWYGKGIVLIELGRRADAEAFLTNYVNLISNQVEFLFTSTLNSSPAFKGDPSYALQIQTSDNQVERGDDIYLDIYIIGGGDVQASEINLNIPPDIVQNNEIDKKIIVINPKDYRIIPIYSKISPFTNIRLPMTYFSNNETFRSKYAKGNDYTPYIINTGLLIGANLGACHYSSLGAPIRLAFRLSDTTPSGDHLIYIYLYYKSNSKWYFDKQVVSIHIKYWYEAEIFKYLAYAALISGILVAIVGPGLLRCQFEQIIKFICDP